MFFFPLYIIARGLEIIHDQLWHITHDDSTIEHDTIDFDNDDALLFSIIITVMK